MPSVSIAKRFSGPPDCANGGYAAGVIAAQIGESVAVRLHKPVPLERPLVLSQGSPGSWEIHVGETKIASARTDRLALALPTPPSYEVAQRCSARYGEFGNPRFSGCFVCGAERAHGYGLCIFPGVLEDESESTTNELDRQRVVAPWIPDPSVADVHGWVRSEIVWAAVDCTGYFASFREGTYALLGEFSVRIDRPVRIEQPYVVVGWPIERAGRKRIAGTALFDAQGEACVIARAIWIEVSQAAR